MAVFCTTLSQFLRDIPYGEPYIRKLKFRDTIKILIQFNNTGSTKCCDSCQIKLIEPETARRIFCRTKQIMARRFDMCLSFAVCDCIE